MKLIAYQDDDGLWRWAIEGETGILLRSEQGYRKRDKALGQWQFLHKRLKRVERFEADVIEPRPANCGAHIYDGISWQPYDEWFEAGAELHPAPPRAFTVIDPEENP